MIETKKEGRISRDSAATVLRNRAYKLRRESDYLLTLAEFAEDLEIGSPEEEALWDVAVRR